jgi:YbgC/YbaW family acyl-CoA thioester hydrolase
MPYEFKMTRRVAFRETDVAGIVHFSHFFAWMEDGEHAFFRSLGLSIHEGKEAQHVGWPRVTAKCEYKAPLRFEDEAEIHLLVKEKRDKSLTYQFRISRIEGEQRVESAIGEITAVCVAWDEQSGKMKAVSIPDKIAGQIEVAPDNVIA